MLSCIAADSAPGRALPGELTREEALALAEQIVAAKVPYVMLCGGEPTIVPYFWELADVLSRGGTLIKIETNGQKPFPAERLSLEAVRSVQISIDGATAATYAKMRPGGELSLARAACEAVHKAGLPLEITFAPTRLNIHEAEAVIALALGLGAFRFNTGKLMRLGTAAKLWERLECSSQQYEEYLTLLELKELELKGRLELCFRRGNNAHFSAARRRAKPAFPDSGVTVCARSSLWSARPWKSVRTNASSLWRWVRVSRNFARTVTSRGCNWPRRCGCRNRRSTPMSQATGACRYRHCRRWRASAGRRRSCSSI